MKYILAVLILAGAAVNLSAEETDYMSEAIQWGGFTFLMASAGVMELQDPWFDKPLIGGEHSKSYKKKETVPYTWLMAGTAGVFGTIVLSPNDEGQFNSVTYSNAKGFYGAFSATLFAAALSKDLFGRRRPSYDNYPADKKNSDGRKSFISGHSSSAFAAAAYGSLFLFEHVGRNDDVINIILKASASAALFSGACYTSWSRVKDHRHNWSDVAAGGVVGTLSSYLFYSLYNSSGKNDRVRITPVFDGTSGSLSAVCLL